jgi:HK97 family phage portal protein
MTSDLLWQHYIWSSRIDGNAYYFKARNGLGAPVELWPLRSDLVEPHEPQNDATELIDYYSYRPRGVEQRLAVEDVIHLRLGLDPTNYRKGYAPLKTVLVQVLGDEEASKFSTALLSNMAVPGVVITPAGDGGPGKEQATAIKEGWSQRFGKDRNGEPLVMSDAMNVEVVSFSPQELDLSLLHRIPEERITGVLGVPAILAGMGAGLARATYSNAEALREFLAEGTVIPDWARVERQLTWNLLTEYTPRPNQRVKFDLTEVRALADDQNELWTRVDGAVRTGWLEVAAAKRTVGIEPKPGDEVYLRSMSTEEVPVDVGMRVAPEPAAAPAPLNGDAEVDELVDA